MLPIPLTGDKMGTAHYCYITKDYYIDNPNLEKILDVDDCTKHSIRTHLCLNVKFNQNNVLIPLRKNLGNPIRPFGRIGYPVPNQSKPNTGLDYRYIMVIDDTKYLKFDNPRISNRQISIIENNYKTIEAEAIEYLLSYTRVSRKNRVERTARFRESSLMNFHKELGI